MSVTGRKIARMDIRLVRGDNERVGARWLKKNLSTGEITEVDLHNWTGVYVMYLPNGRQAYSREWVEVLDDGHCVCDIPPSAFTGAEWAARRTGSWKITVTSPDKTTVRTLAWGYWTLSD